MKRRKITHRIPTKQLLINGSYWLVRKDLSPCGDRLVWWARPDTAGCGSKTVWKTAGNTIEERNTALGNLTNQQIAEHFYA